MEMETPLMFLFARPPAPQKSVELLLAKCWPIAQRIMQTLDDITSFVLWSQIAVPWLAQPSLGKWRLYTACKIKNFFPEYTDCDCQKDVTSWLMMWLYLSKLCSKCSRGQSAFHKHIRNIECTTISFLSEESKSYWHMSLKIEEANNCTICIYIEAAADYKLEITPSACDCFTS